MTNQETMVPGGSRGDRGGDDQGRSHQRSTIVDLDETVISEDVSEPQLTTPRRETNVDVEELSVVEPTGFAEALGPVPNTDETVSLLMSSQGMRQDLDQMRNEFHQVKCMLHRASLASHRASNASAVSMSALGLTPDEENHPEQPLAGASSRNLPFPFFGNFGLGEDLEEDDIMETLPEDSFSFLLVSKVCTIPFLSALMVFAVQVSTFLLLTMNELSNNSNPGNPLGVPVSVIPAVRATVRNSGYSV